MLGTRSNVPRAISGMKESGQLIERQAHVTGVSRKRKAYFLTMDGAKVADEISELLPRWVNKYELENEDTIAGLGISIVNFNVNIDFMRLKYWLFRYLLYTFT